MSIQGNVADLSFLSAASSKPITEIENFVICPYDKVHRILPWRLAVHLIRCARNHTGMKLIRCPFNTTHLLKPEELQDHINICEFRKTYAHFKNPDKLPPTEPRASTVDLVEASENWDEEPAVPSYDPRAYCEKNFVIRNLQGVPPAERKKFRESERRRLKELE